MFLLICYHDDENYENLYPAKKHIYVKIIHKIVSSEIKVKQYNIYNSRCSSNMITTF